jgi:hypothetical protein
LRDGVFTRLGRSEARPRQVDTDRHAVLAHPREVVSGAASAIENSWRRSLPYRFGEERCHEASKALEPEMIAFGSGGGL